MLISFSRPVAIMAVKQLATVDYTVANKVTDGVFEVVRASYEANLPSVAVFAMHALQAFDDVGSHLISLVLFIVAHTR